MGAAPSEHSPAIVGMLLRRGDFIKAPEWVATLIDMIGRGHVLARAGKTRYGIDLMLEAGPAPDGVSDKHFHDGICPWLPTTIGQLAEAIKPSKSARIFADYWSWWVNSVRKEFGELGWTKKSKLRAFSSNSAFTEEGERLASAWTAYATTIGTTATDAGTARHLALALVCARAEDALAAGGDSPVYHLAWDRSLDNLPRIRLLALETWVGRIYEYGGSTNAPGSSGRAVAGGILATDTYRACGGYTRN